MRTHGPWLDVITENVCATGTQKSSGEGRQRTVTEGAESKDTASWQLLVKTVPLPGLGPRRARLGR